MYYIGIDTADETMGRIQNRVTKGGYDVSKDVVERSFKQHVNILPQLLAHCNKAMLFDNYNGFVLAAKYRNGTVTPLVPKGTAWLDKLIMAYNKYWL